MYEYKVVFEDLEVLVVAKDREEAQEKAIDECDVLQGYVTTILAIKRCHKVA